LFNPPSPHDFSSEVAATQKSVCSTHSPPNDLSTAIKVLQQKYFTENTVSIEIRRDCILEDALKEAKKAKI
jgi:hypothetical protein